MRLNPVFTVLGLCALAPGCAPLKHVAIVTICEPAMYCMGLDEWVSKRRNAALAEEAWANFVGALPDGQYSPDFAVGFKAGFEDYLFAGGNGEPPVVPPRGYWKPEFE